MQDQYAGCRGLANALCRGLHSCDGMRRHVVSHERTETNAVRHKERGDRDEARRTRSLLVSVFVSLSLLLPPLAPHSEWCKTHSPLRARSGQLHSATRRGCCGGLARGRPSSHTNNTTKRCHRHLSGISQRSASARLVCHRRWAMTAGPGRKTPQRPSPKLASGRVWRNCGVGGGHLCVSRWPGARAAQQQRSQLCRPEQRHVGLW